MKKEKKKKNRKRNLSWRRHCPESPPRAEQRRPSIRHRCASNRTKVPAVAALVLGSAAHPLPLLSSTRKGDARPSTNAACLRRLWGFAGTATCPHIPFPGGLLRRTPPRVV
uniref:Uncharacterized protein n=1 Tax=Oryza rufipogon TaxID=4529 RepID=A0A0E0MWN6_ORYRU